jgi:hypothetical protein
MTKLLVEGPSEFTRDAYARALQEAQSLPDDWPDKAELVATRRYQLYVYFDLLQKTSAEGRDRLRRLQALLDDAQS